MKRTYTPKQVARAIGVSEASLKRWCDKGLIPVNRTAGGHRRLPFDGVVGFLRQCGKDLVHPEVLGLPLATRRGVCNGERVGLEVDAALDAGDVQRLRTVCFNLFLSGSSICQICDRVLAGAMHRLGQRWREGRLELYQERLACEMCIGVLHEMRSLLSTEPADAPYAVGASLQHDPYTIPTVMVELALRSVQWRADSFGAGLPAHVLCRAILDKRPRLAWVSVSVLGRERDFLRAWRSIQEAAARSGTALVVGGNAITEAVRKQMTFSFYGDNLCHLCSFAGTLWRPPGTATASPSDRASTAEVAPRPLGRA